MATNTLPTFQSWFQALPLIVLLTLAIMWIVQLVRLFTGYLPVTTYALTWRIDHVSDLYRLVTGAFLHGDGLHITLNSLALCRVGMKLENSFGSTLYWLIQTFCVVMASALYVFILYLGRTSGGEHEWAYQSTVGFSGCLFALFVIETETALDEGEAIRLFGLFAIPRRLLPWAMIIFIQMFVPNVSFIGHVSGALVGFLLSRGLGLFLFPSRDVVSQIDTFVVRFSGRYRSVYSRGSVNPFETSAQKPWMCCSQPTSSFLPLSSVTDSSSSSSSAPNPSSSSTSFPTSGGRRLGSS